MICAHTSEPGCLLQESMGKSSDGKAYVITGTWNPNLAAFQALNEDTPKGEDYYLYIYIDIQPTF